MPYDIGRIEKGVALGGAVGSRLKVAVLLVLALGLAALWGSRVESALAEHDEAETIQLALNLQRHGVQSMSTSAPITPSMLREPLPIVTTAAAIGLTDAVLGQGSSESYFSGQRAAWLRVQNVLWMAVLVFAAFWIVWSATASFATATAAAVLSGLLPVVPGVVLRLDQMDTEAPSAALLLIASWLLVIGVTRARIGMVGAAGVAFGLLALTKAAMLYVFFGMIVTLAASLVLPQMRQLLRQPLKQLAVLSLAFAVVVTPWMIRNYVHFGTFNIATRGGIVLMLRAVKDMMTVEEYVGSFYVWAPRPLRAPVALVTGFRGKDLQRGGRLQRLNRSPSSDFADDDRRAQAAGRPEDAISYYRRAQAEQVKVALALEAAGHPTPGAEADKIIQQRAMQSIKQHPWRHLAVTVPFLWRGAAYAFPLLVFTLIQGFRRHRPELALFVWPAFGLVMFYALLTHFIPRYGSPALPVAIVGACLVISAWRGRSPGLNTGIP
jgi:hypothetical protein